MDLVEQVYQKLLDSKESLAEGIKKKDIEHILQTLDIYETELLAQNQELIENEKALQESNSMFESLFEDAPIEYILLSDSFEIQKYNKKADHTFHVTDTGFNKKLFLTHMEKNSISNFLNWFESKKYTKESLIIDMRTPQGPQKFKLSAQNYYNLNKNWILLAFSNINKEHLLKEQVKKDHLFLQNVIDGMQDSLRVIDKNYNVILMNQMSKNMIKEECIQDIENPKCYEVSHHISEPCSGEEHLCPLKEVLKTDKPYTTIHTHYDKDDNPVLEQVTISPLTDENGETVAFIEHASNVTELIKAQEELHQNKYYDSLTGLPNRELFTEQLNESLQMASQNKYMNCLILVDIKNLKFVNESFGHDTGDMIIEKLALVIKECINEEDTISRISGDSFSIHLKNIKDKFEATRLLEKITTKIKENNIEIMFNDIHISINAGIAIYPQDGNNALALFKNAESALNEAKRTGTNYFKFYSEELTNKALDKIVFESSIKKSITENTFELYFQPQYESQENKLIGMEALIRWKEGPLGIISPDKFIPHVEDHGHILELGYWIIKTVFENVVLWKKEGFEFGRVSLNLSLQQLQDDQFIHKIKTLLNETQCDPQYIGIEITESTLMENHQRDIEILNTLSDIGFYLLIDDFGTGYSSLSHLKHLPVQKLKIDKSFIDGLPNEKDDCVIAKTIINLALNLNLELIAEGVETKEQVEYLQELGCYHIQGYYFSAPISSEDMLKLLSNQ